MGGDTNRRVVRLPPRRWKWDNAAIQRRGVADNVVELICGKLRQLAVKSQQILMNAACLGSQSEESSLRLLWGQEGDIDLDFDLHLALLVTEGLLCKVNEEPVRFSFSHDRIQEAVYVRLIPSEKRAEMHLKIARILRASELCSDQRVYMLSNLSRNYRATSRRVSRVDWTYSHNLDKPFRKIRRNLTLSRISVELNV